jgi:hypothetical protein
VEQNFIAKTDGIEQFPLERDKESEWSRRRFKNCIAYVI